MSNTQFAFIQKDKVPSKEALQDSINKLGFKLKLDPEFTPFEDEGFSPCELEGVNEAGFEIYYEKSKDIIEEDEDFKKVAGEKDFCISMCWGGRMKDCASVMIVSAALAKDFDAVISYEGYAPEPIEKIIEDTKVIIKDAIEEDRVEVEKAKLIEQALANGDLYTQVENEFVNLESSFIKEITTVRGDLQIYFDDQSFLSARAFSYTNSNGDFLDSSKYTDSVIEQFALAERLGFEPSDEEMLEYDKLERKAETAERDDRVVERQLKEDVKLWPKKLEIDSISLIKKDTLRLTFKELEQVNLELYAKGDSMFYITFKTNSLTYQLKNEMCELAD